MQKIIIAIDGYSGCGKSTLARSLAQKLDYLYIDSGAMYRAVTYYFLENQISFEDEQAVEEALSGIDIHFDPSADKDTQTLLNGKKVESEIRQMRVSARVSQVAAISAVRRAMVKQQRRLGRSRGIVMDGRDIGTIVFPSAELKIFLTADMEERIRRRYKQLKTEGRAPDQKAIQENLSQRDHLDSNRNDSPLKKAPDAIVIDNTNLTEPEQLAMVLALARERIKRAYRAANS